MSEGMRIFLSKLQLPDFYSENFSKNGYDRVQDICDLDFEDLDMIKIFDDGHRKQIVEAASHFHSTKEYKLLKWLEESGLGRYGINFIHNDFLDLEDIGRLEVERDLYDDLEIVLPGHRKRLKTAVTQLRKRRRLSNDAEDPVAVGYWKRPKKLQDSKNPFLCIEATIRSTKSHGKSMKHEFMVDSGSDVGTLTAEDLHQLDLEFIGTIKSRGVHSTKDKQLYKAELVVGEEVVETEVIPESYESIGNHALRQFRHFINGHTHYWLKGGTAGRVTSTPRMSPSMPSGDVPSTSGEQSAEKIPSLERQSEHKTVAAKSLFPPVPGPSKDILHQEGAVGGKDIQPSEKDTPELTTEIAPEKKGPDTTGGEEDTSSQR